MLVILTEDQILSTEVVCKQCLLADQAGHPRWRKDHLACGEHRQREDVKTPSKSHQPHEYQCQMGFRLAQV